MKRIQPRFFEDRCKELEEKADALSRTCDLALLSLHEAKGNLRLGGLPGDTSSLANAIAEVRARRDEMLAAL